MQHSPLGASGAERWLNCPGSVNLIKKLALPESDGEDYQREGTALHAATAHCITNNVEAWEIAGDTFEGVEIAGDMPGAVQVALTHVLPIIAQSAQIFVEHRISAPIHLNFYGTVDFGAWDGVSRLTIRDFKFGVGVAVDVEDNPQILYYAYGLLQHYPEARVVDLGIIQPRAHHHDGPIRLWEVSAEYVHEWVAETLLPGMIRAEKGGELSAGDWCRFCPAKLVCPMLTGLFETAANILPSKVIDFSDVALGQNYRLVKAVKKYIKAVEDEAFRRLMAGRSDFGLKIVDKRANRVWRDGAHAALLAELGDQAIEPASIKSPSQIEELTGDKALTKQWAYTPESGPTVALAEDPRPARKINVAETFAHMLED